MTITKEQYIQQARRQFCKEGTLEIDDNAAISTAGEENGGAYVQAWVWVANCDVKTTPLDEAIALQNLKAKARQLEQTHQIID